MNRFAVPVLILALSAAACSDSTTTTTPTAPVSVTDTFSGTLTQNGAVSFPFIASASGSIQAQLTTLAPDSMVIVGMSLGTWTGSSCSVVLTNDKASQSSLLLGASSGAGTLCVRIYDVGNVIDPTTFQVQVLHP